MLLGSTFLHRVHILIEEVVIKVKLLLLLLLPLLLIFSQSLPHLLQG